MIEALYTHALWQIIGGTIKHVAWLSWGGF
jgi:hypothetical protein